MTASINPKSAKDIFVYYGVPNKDIATFDFTKDLPEELQPTGQYNALSALITPNNDALNIMGANVTKWMPANLTRCHPNQLSDEFFVERRLNGFSPGRFKRVYGQPWQYLVRYDNKWPDYNLEDIQTTGIFPDFIEARFILRETELQVHSIQFLLNGTTSTHFPGDEEWEWSKKLFRSVEFTFHEIESHLGRAHLNMDQYATAFYRNIVNNPIKELIEPHLKGLLYINKLASPVEKGFIPQVSVLSPIGVKKILKEYISQLSYYWEPSIQALPDQIHNNYFDQAALAMWNLLEEYVKNFFQKHKLAIKGNWSEIAGMSEDLITHSILKPELGTLAIDNIDNLKQLCVYIIYHCTFFHSWVNNKQYEDGGDIEYASIGLWDDKSPTYDHLSVVQKNAKQILFTWKTSNILYNPVMEVGPVELKDLIWKNRQKIEPGIPLRMLMMSINI